MSRRLDNQLGSTLVIVLALVIIAGILGFAAMSVAENQTLMVNRHQQAEKALHFAEAGIHRYMGELNNALTFYDTAESDDMQKDSIAFEDGYFELEITKPNIANPFITIRSTGWQKNSDIKRTVEARLYKKTTLSNIIATNVNESLIDYFNRFIRGDVINGPIHINGDLITNGNTGEGYDGPVFKDKVTYSGKWTRENTPVTTGDKTRFEKGEPVKVAAMGMPETLDSESFKAKAESGGYIYEGRTCIYIDGSTLKIRNKLNAIETKEIPSNGIIYVWSNAGAGDKWTLQSPNVFVSGVLDGRLTIVAEQDIYITASDPTDWNRPKGSVTDPRSKSGSGGVTYKNLNMSGITTKESLATALSNQKSMLGLIAYRNVSILHYSWPNEDPSGFLDPSAYYYTNWDKYGNVAGIYNDVSPYNMNIHASIYAITGCLEYEKPREGNKKNTLTVLGSIVQSSMGPVAGYAFNILDLPPKYDLLNSRNSGYGKNYWHDPRLMYDAPPGFLEPASTGWEIIEWQEVANPVEAP